MSMLPESLFALRLLAGKTYTQEVEQSFRITNAALGNDSPVSGKRCSVCITTEETTFVLCNLIPGQIEQQQLDIVFTEGDQITFSLIGEENISVDLTGNGLLFSGDLDDAEAQGSDVDSMDDEALDAMMAGDCEDDDCELEECDITMCGESELDEEEVKSTIKRKLESVEAPAQKKAKVEAKKVEVAPVAKKIEVKAEVKKTEVKVDAKAEAKKVEAKKAEDKKVEAKKAEDKKVEAKKAEAKKVEAKKVEAKKAEDKKVEAKKAEAKKVEVKAAEAKVAEAKKEIADSKNPIKKTLPSGLILEDVLVGTGPKAKKGKKISVRYIGKTKNGKVFDSNTKGKPFQFRLGGGEVIKGWDLGFDGMQVGGTRKLTIPARLAYGSSGAPPDIPGNAELHFEMKLLDVKN